MTLHSPLALGLTDAQMREVAEVVLNWAAVDAFMGYCLNFAIARAEKPPHLDANVPDLDISAKHKALRETCRSAALTPEEAELLGELNKAYGAWGGERNMVAHGLAMAAVEGGGAALHSERKGKFVTAGELAGFVDHSRYAVHVVMRLNLRFAGVRWDPLGPRPQRPA